MTLRDTLSHMGKALSVRLDDDSQRALARLEAAGFTRSEAIRRSLVEAAKRLKRKQGLAAEVAALEGDETDREEMSAVASLMKSLRATR